MWSFKPVFPLSNFGKGALIVQFVELIIIVILEVLIANVYYSYGGRKNIFVYLVLFCLSELFLVVLYVDAVPIV
jgi:hypothetical protein